MSPSSTANTDRHCQSDPRCTRTPCFRVEVHGLPGTIIDDKAVDTCADHLGASVQSLASWAEVRELRDGYLQVCVIDAASSAVQVPAQAARFPASFPFASIPLDC